MTFNDATQGLLLCSGHGCKCFAEGINYSITSKPRAIDGRSKVKNVQVCVCGGGSKAAVAPAYLTDLYTIYTLTIALLKML